MIDINCDMGEIAAMVDNGGQEALMPFLTSVNIACGGHAGDELMMAETVRQAKRWKLRLGAHPGYPDRENFGRLPIEIPGQDVSAFVYDQIRALADVASKQGAELRHVKPHGALYNSAVKSAALCEAIARGVGRWSKNVILMGLAGSQMLDVFGAAGFAVEAEAFADRAYEPDGTLRSRAFSDSLITDPQRAAEQAWKIAERGMVRAANDAEIPMRADTLCIHGDTAGAVEIAQAVADRLHARGPKRKESTP